MNTIKEYWDNQAKVFKDLPEASWGDEYAIALEVQEIGKHIQEGDSVLDVGCANGHATVLQLKHNPSKIIGVDFSEFMIGQAKPRETNKLTFEVGDAGKLRFENDSFDVVYTTRCLINLPTWREQLKAVRECLRVAKRQVLLSEGFWEPLSLLNSIRLLSGLKPLVEHDFNRYIKKSVLERYLEYEGLKYECIDFSSVYYLGSRFLRELITDNQYEEYTNPINKMFFDLEKEYSSGGFGIQQLYVITL